MHVLALDTTTRDGSVALVDDDHIIEERRGDAARTHAERLPGELIALADAHRLSASGIDLFAVAAGAWIVHRPAVRHRDRPGAGVDGPKANRRRLRARGAGSERRPRPGDVRRCMDGRPPPRGVCGAVPRHRCSAFSPERLAEVEGATVGDPASTLARWHSHLHDATVTFVGDGAALYRDTISNHQATGWEVLSAPLLAGAIGRMAVARAQRGATIDPASVRPLYVRRPDAEVEREKRLG